MLERGSDGCFTMTEARLENPKGCECHNRRRESQHGTVRSLLPALRYTVGGWGQRE